MLLASTLRLHDVTDTEALCLHVVKTSRLPLTWHEKEDLCAHLIGEAWVLSTRYEPGARSFSAYATATLRLRAIDWHRARKGRTKWVFSDHVHERERPDVLSLDDRRERGLDDLVAGGVLDRDGDSFAADLRVLRARARPPLGCVDSVGAGAARRAG